MQPLRISILICILKFTDASPHNRYQHDSRGVIPNSATGPQSGYYSNYYDTIVNYFFYADSGNQENQREHPKTHRETEKNGLHTKKAQHASYVYGRCAVRPNEFPPSGETQQITGTVEFRQLTRGGPTDVKISIKGFTVDDENRKHGFHVHEAGDLTRGCQSLGGHYNPLGKSHGTPHGHTGHVHVGDLGNLEENSKGHVNTTITGTQLSLIGDHSIYGRALVVHQGEDDLGKGGNEGSKKTGNAGGRLACCIIGKIDNDSGWTH